VETYSVILSGVAVFIIGEIFVKFFLGPLHKLKEIKGEIASILLFHANNYGQQYQKISSALERGPEEKYLDDRIIDARVDGAKRWNEDLSKAADETRAVAAKLVCVAEGIPFFEALSRLGLVPSQKSVIEAKSNLIGLSNSFAPDQFDSCVSRKAKIHNLLKIRFMEDD
jgi:hypothetical protein